MFFKPSTYLFFMKNNNILYSKNNTIRNLTKTVQNNHQNNSNCNIRNLY